jgi:CheY-like chemotaxis protein
MTLTCFLVCADAEVVQVLKSVLQELGIQAEYCADPAAAQARIEASAFDLLLFDAHHEARALHLIAQARRSVVNSAAIIIAMVNLRNQVRAMFDSGANFILYKPISRERAADSLRAALDLVRRERRAHPRFPVQAGASIDYAGAEGVSAELSDLSKTGIAFHCSHHLPPSCKVYFRFSFPRDAKVVRVSGELMWQDANGRAGLRLASVPQTSRRILEDWLKAALPAHEQVDASTVPEIVPEEETVSTRLSTGLGLLTVSPADRRNRSRQPCCVGAEIYRAESDVPHRCNLTDVSAGGCYVETTEPHPVGTPLEIVVRTENGKLAIAGRVQSCNRGFGMGVQFVVRTDDQRRDVEQLIACARPEPKLAR